MSAVQKKTGSPKLEVVRAQGNGHYYLTPEDRQILQQYPEGTVRDFMEKLLKNKGD